MNNVVFFEVLGKDGADLRAFYEAAFGWKMSPIPGPMDYSLVEGAGLRGGIGSASGDDPGRTTFYIGVVDIEAILQKIESLGGSRLGPPRPTPDGGQIAFFKDPESHIVGLFNNGSGS
ncbi:MAG TPA: VOC family protein [Candidatus Baltobacteraceae bacterium]|jgi:hypothetical protein